MPVSFRNPYIIEMVNISNVYYNTMEWMVPIS